MTKVIVASAYKRLKAIHKLSQNYNGPIKHQHEQRLLSLMRKHIDEIEELYKNSDPHYLVETGDLGILCFEMLLESKRSLDDAMMTCFERYEKKLKKLSEENK
ncbi:MAG: hypothetical protein P9M07_07815 [Candidatus Aceula meridiana]|nr:hypothetical protein [Candidatus Aceula meridiana]